MSNIVKAAKAADRKAGNLDSAVSKTSVSAAKADGNQIKKATKPDQLSEKEQQLFDECERDIDQNLRGTFILGWRFEQIRDDKLYRATHRTFEAYCRDRWDLSKTHANRHIQAYLCEKHLKQVKHLEVCVPTKESQVRFIADLNPDEQVQVASRVKERLGDKEPSAGDFGEIRQELYPKPKREVEAMKAKDKAAKADEPAPKVIPVQFDTNLVSFSKLKEDADRLYNIFVNPDRKQEGLKIITKFQRIFGEQAHLQAKQTGKEAA